MTMGRHLAYAQMSEVIFSNMDLSKKRMVFSLQSNIWWRAKLRHLSAWRRDRRSTARVAALPRNAGNSGSSVRRATMRYYGGAARHHWPGKGEGEILPVRSGAASAAGGRGRVTPAGASSGEGGGAN